MMKKKNKISRDQKLNSDSNLLKSYNNQIKTEDEEFQYSKRESIINDLKQKGFNELQIDDIFETFKRNSVSNRYSLLQENNSNRIKESYTIDTDFHNNLRKNKRIESINSNSKYKNSFVIKSENTKMQEIYKNKPIKYNCAKLYINASSEKYRRNLLYLRDKKENKYKNNIKIENIKRSKINPIIITSNNFNTNRVYSRKTNQKVGNNINKFKLSYRNSINSIEERKNEMSKKYEFDRNYNFKIIFETKKVIDRTNNIGYLDIKSIKTKNGRESRYKSRNEIIEEKKTSNSISSSNSIIYNKNFINNKDEMMGFNLEEINKGKENNEIKEIKINKKNDNYEYEKDNKCNNNDKIKKKISNYLINELKTINEINKDKINVKDTNNIKNKFEQNNFFNNKHFNKKEKRLSNDYKTNILVIRKQTTEEEEKLVQKNNSISIIKQGDSMDNKRTIESNSYRSNNYFVKVDSNIKSKSVTKKLENNLSKKNHNFVNINLCKDKFRHSSTFYENRGLSIKENRKNNLKKEISFEEEISERKVNNDKINNENNNKTISFNSSIKIDGNSKIKESNNENNNKQNRITNIIRVNKIPNPKSDIHTNPKITNNSNQKKLTYITKKYPNGTYKGYIYNDKREKSGIMLFDNGAKYEGQWKNDKKQGKGVFTSSHYFDCKNFVGMKYEGDFKEDKFEGYGITLYTNGDKYEGEWKNNKQYGKGIVTYFNGEKYEGDWREGMFDGIGTFFLKNGERFEGKFKDNKYNGYGKYFYLNGDWLEGVFRNDHPSGNCILHKKDGTVVNVVH